MRNLWSAGRRGQPDSVADSSGISQLGQSSGGGGGTVEARIVTETPVQHAGATVGNSAPSGHDHRGYAASRASRSDAGNNTGLQGAQKAMHSQHSTHNKYSAEAGRAHQDGTHQAESHQAESSLVEAGKAEGSAAQVVRTVEEYTITLPDQLPVKDDLLHDFKGFCAESGLSPEQAQRAVDFYVSKLVQDKVSCRADCEHALRSDVFGAAYDERLAGARHALTALDGRMQGRLVPMIEGGWGNHPVFVEMMAHVGEMLGEDALGVSLSGGGGVGPMSTEDFLRQEVFRTR